MERRHRFLIVKQRKLHYQFHNPNTAEAAANYIVKVCIDTNRDKVEQAISLAVENLPSYIPDCKGCSA